MLIAIYTTWNHIVRIFQNWMIIFKEKWDVNRTIWHTVPRFNLWLFRVLTKSNAPLYKYSKITWPTIDSSVA